MENIKKPSQMRGERWKFQWLLQCRARKEQRNTSRFRRLKRRVVNPTRCQEQSMHVSWRRTSPRDNVLPKDYLDHIASKGFNSITHYNLVHKFIHMPQAMKIPDAKAAVDKEWKMLETIPA